LGLIYVGQEPVSNSEGM